MLGVFGIGGRGRDSDLLSDQTKLCQRLQHLFLHWNNAEAKKGIMSGTTNSWDRKREIT